jgi:hypothetical protein
MYKIKNEPSTNHGFQVIMVIDYNKWTNLMEEVDGRVGCGGTEDIIWGVSVPSAQFCNEYDTTSEIY